MRSFSKGFPLEMQIQDWLDTLPSPKHLHESSNCPSLLRSSARPRLRLLARDPSTQSDDCSHCSSVESVLELRRPDPEAVLLGLGFGPTNGPHVSRIPERFLQPSKVLTKIDLNKFLEDQGELKSTSEMNVSNSNSPTKIKPLN